MKRVGLLRCSLLRTLHLPTFHRDEAGAKTFDAGIVFVAGVLVDAALAAELGFYRLNAEAIALHRTVAAALAHQLVDDHALGGFHQRAALAAAALFGGAGLVVHDDGAAFNFAQLLLDGVQLIAVVHRHARCEVGDAVVFFGLVGDHHYFLDSLSFQLARHLGHAQGAVHRLAAGHGHGVVEQNFVGDVDARGQALAHRQQARVVVGAVAQIGEHMLVGRERRLADPGHAFAAHLAEGDGAAVHPHRHVMAADTGQRA